MLDSNPIVSQALQRLIPAQLPAIMPGLERTEALLAALGNPHLKLLPVVHIAGTNGKGSVLAYMRAGLEAAGLRVHHYSSPHLVKFSERIVLAGRPIEDVLLLEKIEALQPVLARIPATFFEATTALAFQLFAEVEADVVLLETGLGGRLDSTNVVPNPVLNLITPIALDHAEFLGDTLAKIAAEKAGILKAGAEVVVALQVPEAQRVFDDVLEKLNLNPTLYSWQKTAQGMRVECGAHILDMPAPVLAGEHQYANAAQALAGLLLLQKHFPVIDEQALKHALTNAVWPARLQPLKDHRFLQYLPTGAELWLDGGHNPHAAAAIAAWAAARKRPLNLVLGMLNTKDAAGFIAPIIPHMQCIFTVPIEGESQAQNPDVLAEICRTQGAKVQSAHSIEGALKNMPEQGDVLIAGSLYLAGQVLALSK